MEAGMPTCPPEQYLQKSLFLAFVKNEIISCEPDCPGAMLLSKQANCVCGGPVLTMPQTDEIHLLEGYQTPNKLHARENKHNDN